MAQTAVILYIETHEKKFLKLYLALKTIGTIFKIYWDFVVDWGLFSGTRPDNKWLRDETKFSPSFYYTCMVFNVFGLFIWLVSYLVMDAMHPHETPDALFVMIYFNLVNRVAWMEMIVLALRRTIWVLIRVENEFFNNVEQYRDITIIPPINKSD